MTRHIEFIDTWGDTPEQYYPTAAVFELPEWYKSLAPYFGEKIIDKRINENDQTTATIKKCRPVWDAITSGYLLRLPVDVNVRYSEEGHWFEWMDRKPIEFHTERQAPNYPGQENRRQAYPKFMHPWIVKTPPGYSTLFMSPNHRDLPFHTLEGIVDTDVFDGIVNLPFVFKKPEWEGLLKAGTPIAQVLPIKRESWKMTTRPATDQDMRKHRLAIRSVVSVFNNAYRNFWWQRKDYR
jgi:hypothetical protein